MKNMMALDIETIPDREYAELHPVVRSYVDAKLQRINEGKDDEELWDYTKLASLDWDLGRVVCISLGLFEEESNSIRLKSVADQDEQAVLEGFNGLIRGFGGDYLHFNGLGFDAPFLLKRMARYGIEVADKKFTNLARYRTSPHYDLMQIQANWDYTRTKSLQVLAGIAGLPDPKEAMDGAAVYTAFQSGDLAAIRRYCEFDTATVANLYLTLVQGREVVPLENYRFSE